MYSLYRDSHLPLPLFDRLLLYRLPEEGKLLGRVWGKKDTHRLLAGGSADWHLIWGGGTSGQCLSNF